MAGPAALSKPSKSEQDYQAEDDHRTLSRASEIFADPGRMKRVRRHQVKSVQALKRMGRVIGSRSRR
jgi:hypothetical protein